MTSHERPRSGNQHRCVPVPSQGVPLRGGQVLEALSHVLYTIPTVFVDPVTNTIDPPGAVIKYITDGPGIVVLTRASLPVQAPAPIVVQGKAVAETPNALRIAKIGMGKGNKKRKQEAKAVMDKNPGIFKKRMTRSASKSDPRIRRVIDAQVKGRKLWQI